jgi:hypothetical protein
METIEDKYEELRAFLGKVTSTALWCGSASYIPVEEPQRVTPKVGVRVS